MHCIDLFSCKAASVFTINLLYFYFKVVIWSIQLNRIKTVILQNYVALRAGCVKMVELRPILSAI